MSDRKAIIVRISGWVQGVAYRAWTESQAKRRGLDGWVRNNPDGTVSALFVGPGDAVADMLRACEKGPPLARIDAIDEADGTAAAGDLSGSGFAILR